MRRKYRKIQPKYSKIQLKYGKKRTKYTKIQPKFHSSGHLKKPKYFNYGPPGTSRRAAAEPAAAAAAAAAAEQLEGWRRSKNPRIQDLRHPITRHILYVAVRPENVYPCLIY